MLAMTDESRWKFLTNHALVLLCATADPQLTLREIGDRVGITERAAHRIVGELAEAGYLVVHKVGRRNVYEVAARMPLRHDETVHVQVKDLLDVLKQ